MGPLLSYNRSMHCLLALVAAAVFATASPSPTPPPAVGWTGPLLAPGAGTLPPGGILIEPYLYDSISGHHGQLGSLTYLIYGVAERFSAGLLPGSGGSSLYAQYGLSTQHAGNATPTSAIAFEETFPSTNKLLLNTQDVLPAGSGHLLRIRLDTSFAFPDDALSRDAATEYNLTRHWVLATDTIYSRASPGTASYVVAPAVEYNWSAALGVIAGVRYGIPNAANARSIAPVIAVNYVR